MPQLEIIHSLRPEQYVTYTNTSTELLRGDVFSMGTYIGFPVVDIPQDKTENVVIGPLKVKTTVKATGEVWTAGESVIYWDSTGGAFTTTVGTNKLVGRAAQNAASADTAAILIFDGASSIPVA